MVVERKELWGVGKHIMLFKIGVERQSYGLLVILVILYGRELWAINTSGMQERQIEKI